MLYSILSCSRKEKYMFGIKEISKILHGISFSSFPILKRYVWRMNLVNQVWIICLNFWDEAW